MQDRDKDEIEYLISVENRKREAKRHMQTVSKQMDGSLTKHRINPDTLNAPARAPKAD